MVRFRLFSYLTVSCIPTCCKTLANVLRYLLTVGNFRYSSVRSTAQTLNMCFFAYAVLMEKDPLTNWSDKG